MYEDKLIVFDWGGVIEPSVTYDKCWQMIGKMCHADGSILRSAYLDDPKILTLNSRRGLLVELDRIIKDIPFALPLCDTSYQDITGNVPCDTNWPEAEYLYSVYQTVCDNIPYRRDVSDLIKDLSDSGAKTALLSDAAFWDLKRQNRQTDPHMFTYRWVSCLEGASKQSGELLDRCGRQVEQLGINPENVLYIDDNILNIEYMTINFKWTALPDPDCRCNADTLRTAVNEFLSGKFTGYDSFENIR